MSSKGVNKAIIIGRVGKDPEVRYTPAGKAIASVTVATSESWKDANGEIQEKTEWHRVSIFGKLAEIAGEYLKKGSQVYFEGKIQTRKWQDNDGNDRYTTEIVLDPFNGVMQMLGGKADNQHQAQQTNYRNNDGFAKSPQEVKKQYQQPPPATKPQKPAGESNFDFDDDIPFNQVPSK